MNPALLLIALMNLGATARDAAGNAEVVFIRAPHDARGERIAVTVKAYLVDLPVTFLADALTLSGNPATDAAKVRSEHTRAAMLVWVSERDGTLALHMVIGETSEVRVRVMGSPTSATMAEEVAQVVRRAVEAMLAGDEVAVPLAAATAPTLAVTTPPSPPTRVLVMRVLGGAEWFAAEAPAKGALSIAAAWVRGQLHLGAGVRLSSPIEKSTPEVTLTVRRQAGEIFAAWLHPLSEHWSVRGEAAALFDLLQHETSAIPGLVAVPAASRVSAGGCARVGVDFVFGQAATVSGRLMLLAGMEMWATRGAFVVERGQETPRQTLLTPQALRPRVDVGIGVEW